MPEWIRHGAAQEGRVPEGLDAGEIGIEILAGVAEEIVEEGLHAGPAAEIRARVAIQDLGDLVRGLDDRVLVQLILRVAAGDGVLGH